MDLRSSVTRRRWELVTILAIIVLGAEFGSAALAHDTVGEVWSMILFGAVIALNGLAFAIAWMSRSAAVTAVMLLPAAILVVPRQVQLGLRLSHLQQEGRALVAYLDTVKATTGQYPSDLSGYVFQRLGNRPYFYHYSRDLQEGGFVLYYYVADASTSHRYSPQDGWTYYPD
jgi:hypothetical protein